MRKRGTIVVEGTWTPTERRVHVKHSSKGDYEERKGGEGEPSLEECWLASPGKTKCRCGIVRSFRRLPGRPMRATNRPSPTKEGGSLERTPSQKNSTLSHGRVTKRCAGPSRDLPRWVCGEVDLSRWEILGTKSTCRVPSPTCVAVENHEADAVVLESGGRVVECPLERLVLSQGYGWALSTGQGIWMVGESRRQPQNPRLWSRVFPTPCWRGLAR